MPLPAAAALGAASSGISIFSGLSNLFAGFSEERRRRAALRRQELLDRAERAQYERRFGRVQDEIGDFYSGTEGGAGRLSRLSSELDVATPGLRAGSREAAGQIGGARQSMARSLARRGVAGPAATSAVAGLETNIADVLASRRLGAVEQARGARERYALSAGPAPQGRAAAMREMFASNPVQVDLGGIQTGMQELALLDDWIGRVSDEALLEELRRRRGGAPQMSSQVYNGLLEG